MRSPWSRLRFAVAHIRSSRAMESAAELSEARLTRRLIAGQLSADAYRQAMAQLAESVTPT